MQNIPLVLSVVLYSAVGYDKRKFPADFQFGAASSAFQIEGGWNASDKGESIWDVFAHNHPDRIADGTTGDIACDSYHQWRQDVHAAHKLGLDFYRLSISWARLLPTGFTNVISKTGVTYYNKVINALLEKNIKPVVTLYHWDLPQRLQDLGGWTNPLISDWFEEYANVVFSLYGDRVKMWVTINEPSIMCDHTYNLGTFSPGIKDPNIATYLCNKHVFIAHAKAWRVYDKRYRHKYHGLLAMGNHLVWMIPLTAKDEEAAELAREYAISRYAHPIYSEKGGWPESIEKALAEYSKKKGYATSWLPKFTNEERLLVQGTYDYFSINYYTSRLVREIRPGEDPGVFFDTGIPELGLVLEKDPNWPPGGHDFIPIYPKGLRLLIAWIRKKYGDLNFFITESGFGDKNSDLDDYDRIEYYKLHLEQVLHAIHDDVANVTGFTAWTLMDNYEWSAGYTLKFGLHQVDFSDPKRKRTPRFSAHFYADVIKSRSLDVSVDQYLRKQKRIANNCNARVPFSVNLLIGITIVLNTIIYN